MLTPRQILRAGARICSLRRKLVFESELDGSLADDAGIALRFRYGDRGDLERLSSPEYGYSPQARAFGIERLCAGDRLVVCESRGRVVFYAWVMFGQMDLSCRNYAALPPGCVYTYKLFTVADCRGRRICPAYYCWIQAELRERGYSRLLAWVEAGNVASIRAHLRAGFRQAGCIWHFRFLFRSYFVKPAIAAAPAGRQNVCVS
jgi:L-amino acid N-acyltransferase YncA